MQKMEVPPRKALMLPKGEAFPPLLGPGALGLGPCVLPASCSLRMSPWGQGGCSSYHTLTWGLLGAPNPTCGHQQEEW